MSKLISCAEQAMWELADQIRQNFNITAYSVSIQTEHLVDRPNRVCGPVVEGRPAIHLGICTDKEDPRVESLPLTYPVDEQALPVCYYFVKSAPVPQ